MVDLPHQLEHRMGGNFSTPLRTFEWPGFEVASAKPHLITVEGAPVKALSA